MRKNIFIKSRLQIEDRLLGDLFYTKDKQSRGYLKLSFNNKIANFSKWSDISTSSPTELPRTNPTRLELSYKFPDNLFAIKTLTDGEWRREFYAIPLPHRTCLFIVKIKDFYLLDLAKLSPSPLIFNPPNTNPLVIIFSFPNQDGLPIAPSQYHLTMGSIDLPETPLNKFWIGIANDPDPVLNADFAVLFPFEQRLTGS